MFEAGMLSAQSLLVTKNLYDSWPRTYTHTWRVENNLLILPHLTFSPLRLPYALECYFDSHLETALGL